MRALIGRALYGVAGFIYFIAEIVEILGDLCMYPNKPVR